MNFLLFPLKPTSYTVDFSSNSRIITLISPYLKGTEMTLKTSLILDYICWIGSTVALVYFEWLVLGSIVGAFGIIYLYQSTRIYRTITADLKTFYNGD